MLEFKKKTRAHKWCNYAVYGLLTLSQLSNSGFLTTILSRFHFRKLSPMDKRFSLSHTVLIHQRESEHPSSAIFLKKKYSSRHTNTITTAYYYTPVFNNIGLKRGSLNHTLLMPYSQTANKKELRRIILDRFSVI